MEHPQQGAGIIAGLTAYWVWGLLTIYWKQLHGFGAFELIGWRITLASVVMAIALTATRRWGHLAVVWRDRRLLGRVAVAAALLTVNWTGYVWAVVNGRVLETALAYFIAPLGTVAIGVVVFHERLRPVQLLALGLAATSVVVLTVSYGRVPWLALAIASTWAVYGYLKRQVPLTPLESMAAESFVLVIPAVLLIILLASRPDSVPNSASGLELTYVMFTGVATVAPLMLFAYAAQRVPLTILGPMQYLVPLMNFLIGWLIYDEPLPASRMVGFALVWVCLVMLTIESAHRSRRLRLATTG